MKVNRVVPHGSVEQHGYHGANNMEACWKAQGEDIKIGFRVS